MTIDPTANSSDTAAIIDYVRTTAEIDLLADKVIGVHVPNDGTYQVIDLDKYSDRPRRPTGEVTIRSTSDFVDFLRRYHSERETTLWADHEAMRVTAIINDHAGAGPNGPGWRDWRAHLQLTYHQPYQQWRELHRRPITQDQFADFVEDHLADIHEPAAADLLEIAQTFQAKTSVDFRSARRLHDGSVQLTYHEEINASAGRDGDLAVPTKITLALPVFEGGTPEAITVRLRYKVRESDLRITLIIDDLVDRERTQFDEALGVVMEQWPVWVGSPGSVRSV